MTRNCSTRKTVMKKNNLSMLAGICLAFSLIAVSSSLQGSALPEYATNEFKSPLPSSFRGTKENRIEDSLGLLAPLAKRLELARTKLLEDTITIVHVGDSHVRGHVFPRTAAERLKETFGVVRYIDIGINGATCSTFATEQWTDSIRRLKPELIILSFGTNESYTYKYDASRHYQQIDELVKLLRKGMPRVPILMTTPPGSYFRYKQRKRKRPSYRVNPSTPAAVETIKRYARNNRLPVWDLYEIAGGQANACGNWTRAGLMQQDHVHYLPQGYEIQGILLYQALIKAFDSYAGD